MRGEPNEIKIYPSTGGISTHSPRAGRTYLARAVVHIHDNFNSLAPCGANLNVYDSNIHLKIFQLTRPVRGEPVRKSQETTVKIISTHSPRAGRTLSIFSSCSCNCNFNSLAPCGANRCGGCGDKRGEKFQLTRPVRGEPSRFLRFPHRKYISTHSPRAGRTHNRACNRLRFSHFNSLAPCGANPLRRAR